MKPIVRTVAIELSDTTIDDVAEQIERVITDKIDEYVTSIPDHRVETVQVIPLSTSYSVSADMYRDYTYVERGVIVVFVLRPTH